MKLESDTLSGDTAYRLVGYRGDRIKPVPSIHHWVSMIESFAAYFITLGEIFTSKGMIYAFFARDTSPLLTN